MAPRRKRSYSGWPAQSTLLDAFLRPRSLAHDARPLGVGAHPKAVSNSLSSSALPACGYLRLSHVSS